MVLRPGIKSGDMLNRSRHGSNTMAWKESMPAASRTRSPMLDWMMIELNITIHEQNSKLKQDGGDDETNCCHPFEEYMG